MLVSNVTADNCLEKGHPLCSHRIQTPAAPRGCTPQRLQKLVFHGGRWDGLWGSHLIRPSLLPALAWCQVSAGARGKTQVTVSETLFVCRNPGEGLGTGGMNPYVKRVCVRARISL